MLDRMINSGIFGGLAARLGLILAFLISKLFKVAELHDHKMFILVGMFLA